MISLLPSTRVDTISSARTSSVTAGPPVRITSMSACFNPRIPGRSESRGSMQVTTASFGLGGPAPHFSSPRTKSAGHRAALLGAGGTTTLASLSPRRWSCLNCCCRRIVGCTPCRSTATRRQRARLAGERETSRAPLPPVLIRIRILLAVAAADLFPSVWPRALGARWKRLNRLNAQLVTAVRTAVRAGGDIAAYGRWISHR